MSLPNPNLPVTEERLQEFYQQIKPYLGLREMPSGDMSEIVSPKPVTAKGGHRYSTEEQIVGTWTDGRPVYEKIIESTLPEVTSENDGINQTKNVDISSLNIREFVSIDGVFYTKPPLTDFVSYHILNVAFKGGNDKMYACYAYLNYTTLILNNSMSTYSNRPVRMILRYTKTTD